LRLDGVLRSAEEGFDPQMLLDPLEEEFDLPPTAIELGDGERRQKWPRRFGQFSGFLKWSPCGYAAC
jgi:hypothetical protein